jgi:outer membrane protein OmpA-like peptidoglycan-associated protein
MKKFILFSYCTAVCIITFLNAKAQSDNQEVALTNLGGNVNSKWNDFCPVINADGSVLIFTSRRPVGKRELKADTNALERIYIAQFNKTTMSFDTAMLMGPEINEPNRNNSAIALSNDGQSLLIYRDEADGNGEIWESRLKGTSWVTARKLPAPINSKFHESTASYSPDGNTVYFISNREGGFGGRDIWYCKRQPGGSWGEAINLGSKINTPEFEEGVFIHPDGVTMYFSSKGHGSLGGYDLFYSKLDNGIWSDPQSMGAPFNGPAHDVFLFLDASGTKGYYTSDMASGFGGEDLYLVSFKRVVKESGPRLTLLKGKVYDEKTGAPLEAQMDIVNNASGTLVSSIGTNSASGRYMVSLPAGLNYGISVDVKGYLFNSVNVNMPDSAGYVEVEKDIPMQKLEVGSTIILNNIFYDFDKSTLREDSKSELQRLINLLQEYPTMTIELSSHTDSKGSDEYNQRLSQMRAQSVVEYLVQNGVVKSRLVAQGYGETRPIASNDSDDGRQLNRRTEFKILSK